MPSGTVRTVARMPRMTARELAAVEAALDRIDARKPALVAADRRREEDAALALRRRALAGEPPPAARAA